MNTVKIKYDYEKEGTFSERFPILFNEKQRNKNGDGRGQTADQDRNNNEIAAFHRLSDLP